MISSFSLCISFPSDCLHVLWKKKEKEEKEKKEKDKEEEEKKKKEKKRRINHTGVWELLKVLLIEY